MANVPFIQLLTSTGGGWVIYLLLALSVLALAVIIERMIIITRQSKYQTQVLPMVMEKLENGSPQDLLTSLRRDSILFRLTQELVEHASKGNLSLERHLETRLSLAKRYLEKRLVILGTLGNNAPFIGLLGTVLGVIRAFHDLGASAGQGPEVVMQGISEALVATAVGILVALPCVAFYNLLQKRVKDTLIDVDRFGKQLIAELEAANAGRKGG
jgi:biopolymer transport protein ExbB/TolQ